MHQRDQLQCFAYLTAPNASLYRGIMRVFSDARQHYQLHLRSDEVGQRLDESEQRAGDMDAALDQLCEWGNLEAYADSTLVTTLEDFYRRRLLYQMTSAGVAAERAVERFYREVETPASLQATALADIRDRLREIADLLNSVSAGSTTFDVGKADGALRNMFEQLDQVTHQAQAFFRELQARVELRSVSVEAFLAFKDRLVQYLERFLQQLVHISADAANILDAMPPAAVSGLLDHITAHRTSSEIEVTDERTSSVRAQLRQQWTGLERWFLGHDDQRAQADELRALARSGIREIAATVTMLNQQRGGHTDRTADLRTLAHWFAECSSDGDAHRLWRTAFMLSPARHYTVSNETLEQRDQKPVAAGTSWVDAPPLLIAPTLRSTGRAPRSARIPRLIDNRSELSDLRELASREAEQVRNARNALLTAEPLRLEDLGPLDAAAFPLFLDLLGQALAAKHDTDDIAEATSSDGALKVRLWPTGDHTWTTLKTSLGNFHGRDHWIEVLPT